MAGKKYSIEFMLGAGLESTFAKSFNSASNSMKELQEKVSLLGQYKASNGTKGVRDDLSKTRQAMVLTENAAEKMKGFLLKSFAAIGGIAIAHRAVQSTLALGKDSLNTYADFEQGLANVKSVSGATAQELRLLGDEAKRLGASTAWTAKEVTDAETLLSQAGFGVQETIAALPGLLSMASADQIDLALATDIAAGTLKAFSLQAEDTTRVADVLALAAGATNSDIAGIGEAMKYVAPVSQALKIDLEQTAAAIGALSDANIKGSQAGTVLRAGLARLANPAKSARKVMDSLGFSAFDAQGNMVPLYEMIGRLQKGTEKLSDKDRSAAIATIFGQEAMSGFLALMEQGPERLKGLTEELRNSQGAAEEMANTRLDSVQGSFIMLQSAVDGAKLAIGEKLAPTIKSLADQATDALPGIVEQFDATWKAMTNAPSWQNADWLGKVQIAWDKLISSPFSAWWKAQGKAEFENVAGEIGKTIMATAGGVVKEAFTGSGATQLLAAGTLAMPTIKAGKGVAGAISSLKSVGAAGSTAGAGVAGATKAAGLFGPALSLLTNPIGLAVAGVGALTVGVIAYKKHQEKARQELINMGSSLKEAEEKYQTVADKAELTKSLSEEYRTLDEKVRNNVGTAEELADAQQRMADITLQLQDMFPQTISNYDIENDKIREKLDLVNEEAELEREIQKLKLENTVVSADSYGLEKEIERLQAETEAQKTRREEISEVSGAVRQLELDLKRAQETGDFEKIDQALSNINQKAKDFAPGENLFFNHAEGFLWFAQQMRDEELKLSESYQKSREELEIAKTSYQELYDAQVNLIELDLGTTLEQAAENYRNMTDTEKERFDSALISIDQINQNMKLLTDEPFVIHVQTVFDEAHQLTGVPYEIRQRANAPTFGGLDQYADGGFASKPSIFGEAGLEAAIPIDNRPRSHAILERVNRMMGHTNESNTQLSYTAPSIVIQGNADQSTVNQIKQLLDNERERFEAWYEDKMRQEGRLSFR